MKKLTSTQIDNLIRAMRGPHHIGTDQKGAMKAFEKLADLGLVSGEPYQKDYRANRYTNGVKFSITKEGIKAIRQFGDKAQIEEIDAFIEFTLKGSRAELAKIEARAIELRAIIALFEDGTS
jgi:hypothetical protein